MLKIESLSERSISEQLVYEALLRPDEVDVDKKYLTRFAAKKLFKKQKTKYLLIVIYEMDKETIKIITVISTTKISKYL